MFNKPDLLVRCSIFLSSLLVLSRLLFTKTVERVSVWVVWNGTEVQWAKSHNTLRSVVAYSELIWLEIWLSISLSSSHIWRQNTPTRTSSSLYCNFHFVCRLLEATWKDNTGFQLERYPKFSPASLPWFLSSIYLLMEKGKSIDYYYSIFRFK